MKFFDFIKRIFQWIIQFFSDNTVNNNPKNYQYVTPNSGVAVNIRSEPNTESDILGVAVHEDTLHVVNISETQNIGVIDKWIRVYYKGQIAYIAAWLVEGCNQQCLENAPLGVNLDFLNINGKPDVNRLGNIEYVRLNYNVSMGVGSQDIKFSFETYSPYIRELKDSGYKIIMVFTHQFYGEGAGYVWTQMDTNKWAQVSSVFSHMLYEVAKQYGDLIDVWQIWNEQDAHIGAVASVPIPPRDYARILQESVASIKLVNSEYIVITGGHNSGVPAGVDYIKNVLSYITNDALKPDGIAFHPYGRGVNLSLPYAPFGSIGESINAYYAVLDKPVWITEWGVLDRQSDNPENIYDYASSVVEYINFRFNSKVAALVWYAWSDSMHNGYGLTDMNDKPKSILFNLFTM